MRTKTLSFLAAATVAAVPALVSAQLTTTGLYGGNTGGGLGHVATTLTLMQSPANSGNEQGCSAWNGTTNVQTCTVGNVDNGGTTTTFLDATAQNGQTQTLLLSTFDQPLTGSNVRLGLNVNDNDGDVNVVDIRIILYNAAGGIVFASDKTPAPLLLTGAGPGIGNFGFVYQLSGNDIGLFDAALLGPNGAVRIGAAGNFTDAQNGIESINIGRATGTGGGISGEIVPEPSTYVMLGSGMLGLLGVAARRRRQG